MHSCACTDRVVTGPLENCYCGWVWSDEVVTGAVDSGCCGGVWSDDVGEWYRCDDGPHSTHWGDRETDLSRGGPPDLPGSKRRKPWPPFCLGGWEVPHEECFCGWRAKSPGLASRNYAGHSFRIGMATTAARCGIQDSHQDPGPLGELGMPEVHSDGPRNSV